MRDAIQRVSSDLSPGQFRCKVQGGGVQGGVIPKTAFTKSCKPVHDVIIIPVSSYSLNLETVERKGKKCKKLNISRTKSFLDKALKSTAPKLSCKWFQLLKSLFISFGYNGSFQGS